MKEGYGLEESRFGPSELRSATDAEVAQYWGSSGIGEIDLSIRSDVRDRTDQSETRHSARGSRHLVTGEAPGWHPIRDWATICCGSMHLVTPLTTFSRPCNSTGNRDLTEL